MDFKALLWSSMVLPYFSVFLTITKSYLLSVDSCVWMVETSLDCMRSLVWIQARWQKVFTIYIAKAMYIWMVKIHSETLVWNLLVGVKYFDGVDW